VFDRIDAGANGILDRLRRIDVRGHFHTERVRSLHRDAHLFVGHELLARVVARRRDAARGHQLDQICAAAAMLADSLARLLG
jgi:hypothetical protein